MFDMGLDSSILMGKDSFKIPFNSINQDQGKDLSSFTAFSECQYFPFSSTVDLNKNDVLVVGDMIVRPHFVVETDRFRGHGLSGLTNMSDYDIQPQGDDAIMIDNISYFKDSRYKNQYSATEWAKNDLQVRMMLGIYAAHIPFWFVMRKDGSGGEGCGLYGASKSRKLLFGSEKSHTYLKGDATIRPHMIFAGNETLGSCASGIVTGAHFNLATGDNLIYASPEAQLDIKLNT